MFFALFSGLSLIFFSYATYFFIENNLQKGLYSMSVGLISLILSLILVYFKLADKDNDNDNDDNEAEAV